MPSTCCRMREVFKRLMSWLSFRVWYWASCSMSLSGCKMKEAFTWHMSSSHMIVGFMCDVFIWLQSVESFSVSYLFTAFQIVIFGASDPNSEQRAPFESWNRPSYIRKRFFKILYQINIMNFCYFPFWSIAFNHAYNTDYHDYIFVSLEVWPNTWESTQWVFLLS